MTRRSFFYVEIWPPVNILRGHFSQWYCRINGVRFSTGEKWHPCCRILTGVSHFYVENDRGSIFYGSHFSTLHRPNSIKLGTHYPWMKRIQVCSNKGPRPLQRGDNHKRPTSLTWVTLAHMKILFDFIYSFRFLLPHLTLGSHGFNKLAYVLYQKAFM
jgi:hypothetical protein